MTKGCWRVCAIALAIFWSTPGVAPAFEPEENDAFYIGFGLSNIEVSDSDGLLSGSNVLGGVRVGLFSTIFFELGYGAISFDDRVEIAGVLQNIEFRTTGPHFGLGFLLPIRAILLGAKYHRSVNNRWSEEVIDATSGATISRISGDISFDSYFVFTRFGEGGWFEVGVRRDQIRETDSVLTNSFGPYLMFNIGLN